MKIINTLLMMTSILLCLLSCTTTHVDKDAKANLAAKSPLLWEVSKDGETDYILGTIHVGVDANRLDSSVWQRFNKSDTFVSEISLEDMESTDVSQYFFAPQGKNVGTQLNEKEFKTLEKIFEKQIPEETLKRMSAYGAYTMAITKIFPQITPMDLDLMKQAKKSLKKSIALETSSQQMDIIHKIITFESLKDLINNQKSNMEYLSSLVDAYKRGDLKSLEELLLDSKVSKLTEDQLDSLIFKRNNNWIKAIPDLLRGGTVFLAVGSGHMVGDRGIIELLKKKGYQVARLDIAKQ